MPLFPAERFRVSVNRAECALLVSGDNYPIDFNISKNRISLIIHLRQKCHRRKKSCNKKICLKNHSVIHLELLATYAILPVFINLTPKAAGGMLEHQRSFGKYSGNNFSMVYAVNVLQMIPFSTTQRVCLIEDEEKLGRGADLM